MASDPAGRASGLRERKQIEVECALASRQRPTGRTRALPRVDRWSPSQRVKTPSVEPCSEPSSGSLFSPSSASWPWPPRRTRSRRAHRHVDRSTVGARRAVVPCHMAHRAQVARAVAVVASVSRVAAVLCAPALAERPQRGVSVRGQLTKGVRPRHAGSDVTRSIFASAISRLISLRRRPCPSDSR